MISVQNQSVAVTRKYIKLTKRNLSRETLLAAPLMGPEAIVDSVNLLALIVELEHTIETMGYTISVFDAFCSTMNEGLSEGVTLSNVLKHAFDKTESPP